eukprot:1144337-Pelagomonas_calceolata.AAC.7
MSQALRMPEQLARGERDFSKLHQTTSAPGFELLLGRLMMLLCQLLQGALGEHAGGGGGGQERDFFVHQGDRFKNPNEASCNPEPKPKKTCSMDKSDGLHTHRHVCPFFPAAVSSSRQIPGHSRGENLNNSPAGVPTLNPTGVPPAIVAVKSMHQGYLPDITRQHCGQHMLIASRPLFLLYK